MILYRVVSEKNIDISNEEFSGVNSFEYEKGIEYLHFFILPENASTYQQLRYSNEKVKSKVLKCDIPYELIKDNFGIGMYRWYYPKARSPFLEVRLKKDVFKNDFIIDSANSIKPEWNNEEIYNRFMKCCVDNLEPVKLLGINPLSVELNNEFNFLHYFSKNDLQKENIDVFDYPEPIDVNEIDYYHKIVNTKKADKNILTRLKENIISIFNKQDDNGKKIK